MYFLIFSDHDLSGHFLADGDAGLLDLDDDVSAQGRHHCDGAPGHKAQVLQMLFHLGAAAHPVDDDFLRRMLANVSGIIAASLPVIAVRGR